METAKKLDVLGKRTAEDALGNTNQLTLFNHHNIHPTRFRNDPMETTKFIDLFGGDSSFSPAGCEWQHAFAKYGFADGDGREYTPMVANKLAEFGIKCDIVEWSCHNHAIAKMTTSDGRVFYDRCPSEVEPFTTDDRIVSEAIEDAFGEDWKRGLDVGRAMDEWWARITCD